MAVQVGIIGATGYAGEFLVRILSEHPEAELAYLSSGHAAGKEVAEVLPALKGSVELTLQPEDIDAIAETCDCVFIAKKSVESMKYAPILLKKGIKVIDIGGEFRLKDAAQYKQWYGETHLCPQLLDEAVYGLCELNRDAVKSARLVSNPGCYPTGTILGLTPLLKAAGDAVSSVNIAASSGLSGAGRTAASSGANLFVNCFNNHSAYKAGSHKHTPEIEQALGRSVTFIPQLASIDRGILGVSYINLKEGTGAVKEPNTVLREAYADEPFIRIYDAVEQISAANVRGTNYCDICAIMIERSNVLLVVTAIDNLIKGAAGQAVQNMNILNGLPETTGLLGRVF